MIRPLRTALRTLTIIPVPGKDCKTFSDSLMLFPLVGLLLGGVVYVVARVVSAGIPDQPLLSAFFATVTLSVITGGLHIDGLADVADAFGGGRDREQVLTIMKDSRHGTFGVMAIVFITFGKIIAIMISIQYSLFWVLIIFPVVGRGVQAAGCSALPYARSEGGKAGAFVKKQPVYTVLLALITVLAIGISVMMHFYMLSGALFFTCCAAVCFYLFCMKRIGGITGDCLGAVNEIAEISFLFSSIVLLNIV